MKILILSLCTRDLPEMYEISFANKSRYAARHGYEFRCYRDLLDPSRHPNWNRIPMLEKEIAEGSWDWIFWSDADALFVNPGIKLESFLDSAFDLILGTDAESLAGGETCGIIAQINCGNFLLRSSQWSRELLLLLYAETAFINHVGYEQATLKALLRESEELRAHVKFVPLRLFNSPSPFDTHPSINNYLEGDFVIHFPGLGGRYAPIRLRLMREAASRIDWG